MRPIKKRRIPRHKRAVRAPSRFFSLHDPQFTRQAQQFLFSMTGAPEGVIFLHRAYLPKVHPATAARNGFFSYQVMS